MNKKLELLTSKQLHLTVEAISKYYAKCRRAVIVRNAYGIVCVNDDINTLEATKLFYDLVIDNLVGNSYIIIHNEVRLGKINTNWFAEYMSDSTYYRVRVTAYIDFLRCIDE